MKRKKWSEAEEESLLSKYSELVKCGSLSKLKTREKKFRPIADHLNSTHHLSDPSSFPFSWSWRDVSIKLQNMRHQYLSVKQKIRLDHHLFDWPDGANHWDNFLRYKEVFGDIHPNPNPSFDFHNKPRKKFGFFVCSQVLDLKDMAVRREEGLRERDFEREESEFQREEERKGSAFLEEKRRVEREQALVDRECGLEHRRALWAAREVEKRMRLERELSADRRRRMRMEEEREEEEMEWRERLLGLQVDHEKQMMQMHADACHNQMQILGIMARFVCQFFGSAADGMGAGLGGALTPLQGLQDPGGLGDDNGKPDANSPSEFL